MCSPYVVVSAVMVKWFEKLSLNVSILSFVIHQYHPCSFMVYYYLFGVFLFLYRPLSHNSHNF